MFFFIFHFVEDSSENQSYVVNDDKWWCQGRPAMIFNNQVVALNFPEDVCIALNNLKSVTLIGEKKKGL